MSGLLLRGTIALMALLAVLGFRSTRQQPVGGDVESEELNFRVDTLLTGLKVPWGMAFLPNGDMLFTERKGEVYLYSQGKLNPKPIAGVPEVLAKGQGGLFDIQLHPNYTENGWIYLAFSSPAEEGEEGKGSNTALMRVRLKDHSFYDHELLFKASPNYETNHHYGGRIAFDKAGYLYLSVGDRGGHEEVQDLKVQRGRIFRLYDDGRIPEDNPFVGQDSVFAGTFSYGHRNPQGMVLNPWTGEIWAHEHGPKGGDELNIVRAGLNYGWPAICFGINYDGTILTPDTARAGMEQPITYWVPSIGPCGMDFVTHERYGAWKGDVLVGSMSFRYLVRCEVDGNSITHREILLNGIGRVRAITQAPDGYIYIATEGPGMILRLVPA
ncbi:MAG: PQQ-dependent sugar dehydrogenase [Bacteroidia bacterium]